MKTFEDYRIITSLIEENDDLELYKFLTKDISHLNSVDKFLILLKERISYLDDTLTLSSNDGKSINVNLNMFITNFSKQYKDIKTNLILDDYNVELNYPKELYHDKIDDLLIDCVYNINYKNTNLNLNSLSDVNKKVIFEILPAKITEKVKEFINTQKNYILMESKLGISPVEISLFNNSAFELIKILNTYYSSSNIIETIFFLSKRISDITYLNSRTPKEINQFIKLYSEEVEKMNQENKS